MTADGPDAARGAGLLRQMDAIATRFLARTEVELESWSARLAGLQAAGDEVFADLELFAHRIHGSSAIFGFMALSHQAGVLETAVRELRGRPVDDAAVADITQRFAAVATECRQAASGRAG